MRFKETREDLDPKQADSTKKKKAKKKPRKSKFEWKATVVHGSDYIKDKSKKTKEEIRKLRIAAFASTNMMWKPYALLIADYFNNEYNRNFDFIFDKLKGFNNKKSLTKKDLDQLKVLISINELKYYVKDNEKEKTIDINLDLIQRDFFVDNNLQEIYSELIEESDSKYHHSMSYLLKLYNLLISFVVEKETKEIFYKTYVLDDEKHGPLILNEKIIKVLPTHNYLSDKYQKKAAYKYGN